MPGVAVASAYFRTVDGHEVILKDSLGVIRRNPAFTERLIPIMLLMNTPPLRLKLFPPATRDIRCPGCASGQHSTERRTAPEGEQAMNLRTLRPVGGLASQAGHRQRRTRRFPPASSGRNLPGAVLSLVAEPHALELTDRCPA